MVTNFLWVNIIILTVNENDMVLIIFRFYYYYYYSLYSKKNITPPEQTVLKKTPNFLNNLFNKSIILFHRKHVFKNRM